MPPATDSTTPRSCQYRPFGLLAELTYKCPLHCPYCSNPVSFSRSGTELSSEEWRRVIQEAAELGVLHILFSGGEPLLYRDLPTLVASAHEAGMFTNLITSGLGLTAPRAEQLLAAHLDSVQISFQAADSILADRIAGVRAHVRKLAAAHLVRELQLPLTINVVLHRGNIEQIAEIIELAEQLDAQRLELANTQFYGWAFQNKELLLPTRAQIQRAEALALQAKRRLLGRMEILYVLPDYYGSRPKPCMHGWGQRFLTVNPVGDVLPCQTASEIPSLRFENVRERSLAWIWHESEAFERFRGSAWMPEPCRSCDLREQDFGGCRCQAALLTGDPAATDPACSLSPHHAQLTGIVEQAQSSVQGTLRFRQNPT